MISKLRRGAFAVALAATSFTMANAAEARERWRDGGGDEAAIAIGAGLIGLAIGAALADRDDRYYYDRAYYPHRRYVTVRGHPGRYYYYDGYPNRYYRDRYYDRYYGRYWRDNRGRRYYDRSDRRRWNDDRYYGNRRYYRDGYRRSYRNDGYRSHRREYRRDHRRRWRN